MHKVNLLRTAVLLAYPALIASVASIALEVHIVPLVVFILSMIAGFLYDRRSNPDHIIKPMILFFLVIIGIVISLKGISEDNFFERVFGILLIITSAKLISPKKARDILQIYLLNFFIITGSAVTRLDLEFGLLVLGEAYISILGFILIYGSREQKEIPLGNIWKLTTWSGIISVCLIPFTIIIFLIIPRPTMTMFSWGGGTVSSTGFSDTVSPGSVGEIKSNNIPAFRVRWMSGVRPEKILWRGIVYDTYEQGTWKRSYYDEIESPDISDEFQEYEVILEPTNLPYLFSAGIPLDIWSKSSKTSIVSGYTIQAKQDINHRTLYRVKSHLGSDIPADSPPHLFLDIPDELSEQLSHVSSEFMRESNFETAKAVEIYLKTEFSYDLAPGESEGDPVLHFLNVSQKGHCEYFASSMALLLRSIGIPARIVGGYLKGEWNDLGQYFLVRQSDAHTWVEVWIKDRGWVTFDPTPASSLIGAPQTRSGMSRVIDFLRLKWYYWVLDYNIDRQFDLVRKTSSLFSSFRTGNFSFSTRKIVPDKKHIFIAGSIILLIIIIIFTVQYYRERPKTWGERFVYLFQKNGYHWLQGQTLKEFIANTALNDFSLKKTAISFVEYYYLFEYGSKGNEKDLGLLFKKTKNILRKKHNNTIIS